MNKQKTKSDIEIRFGGASTREKQEFLDRRAIEFDVSVERALLIEFEDMFTSTWMRKNEENIFELLFLIIASEKVICRDVEFGTYKQNNNLYPKITIHGDFLKVLGSDRELWICDEYIEAVGMELDLNFDYEYVGFLRKTK
jgi:hypothetical protein